MPQYSLKDFFFGCSDRNYEDRDIYRPSAAIKMAICGTAAWIQYICLLCYNFYSLYFLIVWKEWRTENCEALKNIWLYQCLSMVMTTVTIVVSKYISTIKQGAIFIQTIRHIAITVIALAFASYGSGVIGQAAKENLHGKECRIDDNRDEPKVDWDNDSRTWLVWFTMMFSWALFLYMIYRGFLVGIYGCQFLSRTPKYVKIGRVDDVEHDPNLILGKTKKIEDSDDEELGNTKMYEDEIKQNNTAPTDDRFSENKMTQQEYNKRISQLGSKDLENVEDIDSQHLTKYSRVVRGDPNVVFDNIYREYPDEDNKKLFTKSNENNTNNTNTNTTQRKRHKTSILSND